MLSIGIVVAVLVALALVDGWKQPVAIFVIVSAINLAFNRLWRKQHRASADRAVVADWLRNRRRR